MNEVRGTLSIKVMVQYRKPGEHNKLVTWSKLVQIHVDRGVTLEQAQECLEQWKQVNPEVVGSFAAAMY
jgi:outer membrane PBP1 activator LpoA protein